VIAPLVLKERQFDLLAAGGGDSATIAVLMAGQYSKNVLLIQEMMNTARPVGAGVVRALQDGYALLTAVQRAHPNLITTSLGQPQVGLWASDYLQRAHQPSRWRYGYLACLAASVALRAGTDFEIDVPVHAGVIPLPGFGCVKLPAATSGGSARIRGEGGHGTVTPAGQRPVVVEAGTRAAGWEPAHLLHGTSTVAGEAEITVLLDDRDPYRAPPWLSEASPMRPGVPLRRAELRRWRQLFDRAWRLLAENHAQQAMAMATGLRVLVPMRAREGSQANSATALDAFGAVLLTAPTDHLGLALTLLHEYQHGKLAALTDLVTLHGAGDDQRYFAPWREDSRPLGALLQGAYAHLAVAAFWRQQARCGVGGALRFAQFKFAACRDDVRRAVDQIAASGELTAHGERFIAGMTATLDSWQADPLPAEVLRRAADQRAGDRLTWRLRRVSPAPGTVDVFARMWLAPIGSRGPATDPSPEPTAVAAEYSSQAALSAARGSARQLAAFTAVLTARAIAADETHYGSGHDPEPSMGDLAYARGQYAHALSAYLAELADNPAEPGAWTGVALASRQPLLLSRPELVRAVYLRVRELGGPVPDPVALAAWLARRTGLAATFAAPQ
jgi:HEXXH motif-containing protein